MPAITKTATDLFHEYRLDYEAALEPCIVCLIARCPESELKALDTLLEDFMVNAGHPPYSPVQQRRQMEKLQPLMDRAKNHPAVLAADDQRAAQWRDTPWWKKARSRIRFRWFIWRVRLGQVGRRKPWE